MKRLVFFILLISACLPGLAVPGHNARSVQIRFGLSGNGVRSICQDDMGFIWFGTDDGLDRHDTKGIVRALKEKLGVNAICELDGTLFIGTDNGLMYFDPKTEEAVPFSAQTKYGVVIVRPVTCLKKAGRQLLIGTQGQGAFLYDASDGTLTQYSIGIPDISDAAVGRNHAFYVSVAGQGIYQITPPWTTESISLTVAEKNVTRLLADGDGLYYAAGTVLGRYSPESRRTVRKDCGMVIHDLTARSKDLIVLGGSQGIAFYDTVCKDLRRLDIFSEGKDLSSCAFSRVFLDREGSLWAVSPSAGTLVFTEKDLQIKTCPLPFPCERMRLEETTDGQIRIYTPLKTLLLNPEDGRIVIRPGKSWEKEKAASSHNHWDPEGMLKPTPDKVVTSSCRDSRNNLYEAVGNGIYKSSPLGGEKQLFRMLQSVLTLFCDSRDQIWAGTGGKGLWLIRDDTPVHIALDGARGPAGMVYSIIEDNESYLWVCSDIGIACLDPLRLEVKSLITTGESGTEDRFLPNAVLKSRTGQLWFGRDGSLLSVPPSTRLINKVRPQVSINSLSFRNGAAPLTGLGREERVEIPWENNSLTLHFSVQSYQDPERNRTSCMMQGVDDEFVRAYGNSVSYSQLRPGSYRFTVRGYNNDGIESRQAASLLIVIIPPWWMSRPMIFLYALLLTCSIVLLYFWWRRRLDRQYARTLRQSQESLVIGMVHEIRTPITIIRLALEHMTRNGNPPQEDIRTMKENLDYMQETVNSILTCQRNDREGAKLNHRRTEINQLCIQACERFRESARLQNCTLDFIPSGSPIPVMGDEDALRKVLGNLLSNALKYARHAIIVRTALEDGNAVIRVEDDGPGIKNSEKKKIFDMFYKVRGDKIAQASGMGVGLAYSAQLVAVHGGTIDVEDAPSGGAAFRVRLPAGSIPEADGAEAERTGESPDKPRALMVDDNPSLLDMLRRDLSEDYCIRTARDGREALSLVEKEGTDIIVSDVMMPVMDGVELCRAIKGRMDYSHIPFILLTAKTSMEAKTEGMESGADAYVEKPFTTAQLRHQMGNLLRLRDSLRKHLGEEEDGVEQGLQMLNKYDRKFMEDIHAAIEDQILQENFSIDSLADTMCMSKTNFYRKFHAITGDSPNEYIKNYRLTRAARLIREGARINEAAYSVGFYSSSYFAKCFKARFGVLPKDYK